MLQLILGNRNYSSWSMRGWLLLKHAKLEFSETFVQLGSSNQQDRIKKLGGQTAKVPILLDDGFAVWDSLAIAEYAHDLSSNVWPEDVQSRARARSLAAEMHSGFPAIRSSMPCNIRARSLIPADDGRLDDEIARIAEIWSEASGTWLCGEFSAFYAPVATRLRTYDIPLSDAAWHYQRRLLNHPLVEEWCSLAAAEPREPQYERPARAKHASP